jgi:Na+/H+ antiporter NhaD/arsenite permease-like protein
MAVSGVAAHRHASTVIHSAAMHAPASAPALPWTAPFVALLLAIAILPLAAPRFWESNLRKLAVAGALGAPVFWLYLHRSPSALLHTGIEYASFIALLGSLFVISGGILLTGDLEATPRVNTLFLAAGTLLASFVGTTGASMLLIGPLLTTNRERRHVRHTVVFFIFLVANIGGCLTPLGDPPLFLGYLKGVPFFWTLRLFPAWLLTSGTLLAIYYLWDRRAHAREAGIDIERDRREVQPLRVAGSANLLLLAGVLVSVLLFQSPWREIAMLALAVISLARTPRALREANHFTFHPIQEVAVLFAGIFVTMLPALDFLRARGAELGLAEPWHFFWATGMLSSFLDNAPTYLVFLAVAQGAGLPPEVVGVSARVLTAISLGAVFMGANTYIGNGPNFMVRSIAEARGLRMPSFAGYMLYSGLILLPTFALVTWVFLL